MAFCSRWRWRDLLPGGCGEDMIFGGIEDVSGTNGRLAPFLTVHFADRSTCQTVHFLRERLRTDRTDASRGVTPKK